MPNAILFGVDVLLLIAIWHMAFKPAVRDYYWACLAELRRDAFGRFAAIGALGTPAHRAIDALLKHSAEHLNGANFWRLVLTEAAVQKDASALDYAIAENARLFTGHEKQAQEIIDGVRKAAWMSWMGYAIHTSVVAAIVCYLFVAPGVLAQKTWNYMARALTGKSTPRIVVPRFSRVAAACTAVVLAAQASVFGRVIHPNHIEALAFQTATPAPK